MMWCAMKWRSIVWISKKWSGMKYNGIHFISYHPPTLFFIPPIWKVCNGLEHFNYIVTHLPLFLFHLTLAFLCLAVYASSTGCLFLLQPCIVCSVYLSFPHVSVALSLISYYINLQNLIHYPMVMRGR